MALFVHRAFVVKVRQYFVDRGFVFDGNNYSGFATANPTLLIIDVQNPIEPLGLYALGVQFMATWRLLFAFFLEPSGSCSDGFSVR